MRSTVTLHTQHGLSFLVVWWKALYCLFLLVLSYQASCPHCNHTTERQIWRRKVPWNLYKLRWTLEEYRDSTVIVTHDMAYTELGGQPWVCVLIFCLAWDRVFCFSSLCVRLSGEWASRDHSVSGSNFVINTLGLQICTMACLSIWLMGNWIQILNICEGKALAFEASPQPFSVLPEATSSGSLVSMSESVVATSMNLGCYPVSLLGLRLVPCRVT